MGAVTLTRERVTQGAPETVSSTLPALFDEHYRSLVKLASFYLDDVGAAEEVVQDAFVKLVSGRYRVGAGKEGAYLRSMVLNGARSALRKRRVRRAKQPPPPMPAPAAEEGGVAAAERQRMLTELRKLPAKQAAVLMLRYYDDRSEREIADILGIAPGSVKSHAHRGLGKLRVALEGSGDDGP